MGSRRVVRRGRPSLRALERLAGSNCRRHQAAIARRNPGSEQHDTQPWLFDVRENAITVFADRARNLGTFDPFRREMHLALGAAIENLVLTARAFGLAAKVAPVDGRLSLSPDDKPALAANIAFTPAPDARDALFAAIPKRLTNRGPFRADQSVAAECLRRFADLVTEDDVRVVFVVDKNARGELGALIVEATNRMIGDPQMSTDSARWFRTGRRDIAAHRDGVTAYRAGLSPLLTAVSKLLPDLDAKSADQYWLSMTRDTQVSTAPVPRHAHGDTGWTRIAAAASGRDRRRAGRTTAQSTGRMH